MFNGGTVRNSRSSILLILAAIGLAVSAAWPSQVSRAQSDAATVRVVPPSDSVTKSTKGIDVSIDVANVTNLAGFQFVLVVDPSVLKPLSARKTAFLSTSGREIFCPEPTIEDAAIRYACVTLRETPAGVDGSGTIATVSLQPAAKGTSDLVLKEVRLVHPDGTEIASTTADSRLSVTGGTWWSTLRIALVAGGGALALLVVLALVWRLRARSAAGPARAGDPAPGA